MSAIPPGYVTRVRAAHLIQELLDRVDDICKGMALSAAQRCAPESDVDKVCAILDEETRQAIREIELLQASICEQLEAAEH